MVDCLRDLSSQNTKWKHGMLVFIAILFTQCHQIEASRKYLGCYKYDVDDWHFAWGPPEKVNYDVANCVTACERNGFEKAGLMNGSLCRCTNMALGAKSQSCTVSCVGKWDAICGGDDALSVYSTIARAEDSQYVGCWTRSGGPVLEGLPSSQVPRTDLTSCVVNCRKQSNKAFQKSLVIGVNKTHCLCGNKLSSSSKTEDVSVCKNCGGESEKPCPVGVQMLDVYIPECPNATYGPYCSPCNCHGNEICDVTTGSCPGACADGWLKSPVACSKACEPGTFGQQCAQQCHCADSLSCDPETGSCPTQACMPGFTGQTCSQACDFGTFGANCSETCNCLNATDCDSINGTCILGMCAPGWKGADCQLRIITTQTPALQTSTVEYTQASNFEKKVVVERTDTELVAPDMTYYPSWSGSAAGGGAGGIIVLAIVGLAVILFVQHRRKHNRKMKAYAVRMKYLRDNHSSTPLLNDSSKVSKEQRDSSSYSIPSPAGSPGMTSSPGSPGKPLKFCMTAEDFVLYFQRRQLGNDALASEFSMLKRGQLHSWKAAASNPNRKRFNRLVNILPFDFNRVILEEENETENDYINASYIRNYDGEKNFIATQGPKQETVGNYWRMVWNCNVKYIIMLTKLMESGRIKCIRYWPAIEGVPAIYDDKLAVTMTLEDHWSDFVIRKFVITMDSDTREVTHYQFRGWPEMGVPRHTMPFIVFMQLVRSQRVASGGRTAVHCSTGAGRTGIFLATDILWDQLALHTEVDVPTCIQQLREQRINMVQTLDQYSFIYTVMYDSLTVGRTRIAFEEFLVKYQTLKDDFPGIIEKQFKILELLEDAAKRGDASGNLNDSGRGSVSDILTVSERRPESHSSCHSISLSQYIPVNGYYSQNAFLISRFPGLVDPQEFWSTVHDNNSRIIVSFTAANCCWPDSKGNTESFGTFTVTCIGHSTTESTRSTVHHIVLELSSLEIEAKRFIDVYQANIDGPLTYDILDLHAHLQSAKDVTGSLTPIVIYNSSNYQIAGVLCALNVLAEMLYLEKEVDIFLAVQRVRAAVPFFIDIMDVYQHLHDLTASYINSLP